MATPNLPSACPPGGHPHTLRGRTLDPGPGAPPKAEVQRNARYRAQPSNRQKARMTESKRHLFCAIQMP